jgi:ribosomal protein L37AE/L43A
VSLGFAVFQGSTLRCDIRVSNLPFDGRTLNGASPCLLLHTVQRLPAGPGCERAGITVSSRYSVDGLVDLLAVQKPGFAYPQCGERKYGITGVPRRNLPDLSDEYNNLIDNRLPFPKIEMSSAPNIFRDRPPMPFVASELKATGPLQGVVFKQVKKQGGTGTVWLIARCTTRIEKAKRRSWHAKAERLTLKQLASQKLVCVQCGENTVERFGEGFVLCDICETAPAVIAHGWKQDDWNEHFDFNGTSNPKDHGFQDAERRKMERKKRKQENLKPNITHLAQLRYVSPATPYHSLSEYELPRVDRERFWERARPLLEDELAWILAVKYPGFTNRNSPAYLKAQRAAAQLAAHFIFGRGFAEIVRMVPVSSRSNAEKLCKAVRADYMKYVRQHRGHRPEEASRAIRSGMLRSLYAPALTTGHLCRSRTCCTT